MTRGERARPSLSDALMAAAWRTARRGTFTAAGLLRDPGVGAVCQSPHRVACQAQYLEDAGWFTRIAGHPEPRWSLSLAWKAEFERREWEAAGA